MSDTLQCISPVDGRLYVERPLAGERDIDAALEAAARAQADWRRAPLERRQAILDAAIDRLTAESAAIAEELAWQMGRPVKFGPKELAGFEERARHMVAVAPEALADLDYADKPGFTRFIRREPLGTVFVVAPWNYPFLTSVNVVWPALMAGNAVVMKPSAQTPLTAERYAAALAEAGLPAGLFQVLHLSHADSGRVIGDPRVDFVSFTGSVAGGHAVQQAAARRFIGVGLELGGKDPAYVRADADLDDAVAGIADGAFFNSGQSCCAIERIYVHRDLYEAFVEGFVEEARGLVLGDPLQEATTLGPMVRTAAADSVRGQVAEAVAAGARALVDANGFPAAREGTAYLAPQALTRVDHGMRIMTEETFGPAVGIMPVADDDEAVGLMNDSPYGLTAAIWTRDAEAALAIGERVETGTWFMNRCDYLDPALAWTGVKDSGRGCSLSVLGYEQLTRPKSFHLKRAEKDAA